MTVDIYINGRLWTDLTTEEQDAASVALTRKAMKAAGYIPLQEVADEKEIQS